MAKNKKPEFEFYIHDTYFSVSVDAFRKAIKLKGAADKIGVERLETLNKFAALWEEIGANWLISITFSALCVEAYINHYAIENLSKNYFKNYLDKLNTISKWIIIPRIITGKQIEVGSIAIQNLKTLITLRHKLVHFKTRYYHTIEDRINDIFPEYNDVELAIKTPAQLILEIKKIDRSVDLDWVIKSVDRVKNWITLDISDE
jgi:hypothetical protein